MNSRTNETENPGPGTSQKTISFKNLRFSSGKFCEIFLFVFPHLIHFVIRPCLLEVSTC